MGSTGRPYHRTSGNPSAGRDCDLREIRQGHLETWHRLDRQGPHPRYRPGKRHHARDRRSHGLADLGGVVHTPVTAVLSGRGETGHEWAVDGRAQTDRSNGKYDEHHSPFLTERTNCLIQSPGVCGLTS